MLKNFVEIKLEICSIYKAQCAEENNLLKFTELCISRDTEYKHHTENTALITE